MAENKTLAFKVELKGTEIQKKKLAGLETEVKKLTLQRTKLNKQLKDGTINTKQYGSAIAKVNTGLKAHRRELLVTRQEMLGIDGFTTRLGKSFARLGTSVAGAFAGMFAIQKIGQLFSQAVTIFKDFEQSNANLASVLGTTSDKIGALTEDAKRLGAATAFSATEVSKLQTEFAKLGFTEKQILDATEATLDLAAATGSDLAEAAAIAGATLGGFGLQAEDTQELVDVMAKSFSTSALDIEKFRESMKFAAPAAKAVGISVTETTALLGTLANAGISGSLAGTGLAKSFTMLNKVGLTLQEGLDQVANSQDKLGTATKLVGQTAAKSFLVLSEGTKITQKLKVGLENAGGAAKRMADTQLDTLEGKTKILNSAWEGLVLGLTSGDSAFNSIAKGIVEATTSLLGFLTPTTKVSEALEDERTNLFLLEAELKNANTSEGRRLEIIKDLQKEYPKFLGNVDAETVSNTELTKALRKVNDELINRIIIEEKQEEIDEQNIDTKEAKKDAIEAEGEALKKAAEIEAKLTKQAKDRNKEIQIEATPEGLTSLEQLENRIKELNRVRDEQNRLRNEDSDLSVLSISQLSKLSKQINALNNRYVALKNAEEDYNDEVEIGNKLIDDKQELLDKFKMTTEESSDVIEENTNATNKNNKATKDSIKENKLLNKELEKLGIKQKDINKIISQELEETDDVDPLDDEDSFSDNVLKKSTEDKFDFLNKNAEKLGKLNDKQKDEEVKRNAKSNAEQLQQQVAFNELLDSKKIELAQQTANALIDVSNRRIQREKDLELSALDAQLQNGLISQQEFEKQREAIERKAFNKRKKIEIAQVAISLAAEIASINANAAANPANAFTFGGAGISQASVLTGIAVARSAIQAGVIASQKFADGGFTGAGYGSADSTGFKQAGVVHEGEYVVPKHVLDSQKGGQLVGALESMRMNKPTPLSSIGFANGGFTSGSNMDISGLRDEITSAVISSMGAIKVQNVATDTTSESIKVNNIMSEATFG